MKTKIDLENLSSQGSPQVNKKLLRNNNLSHSENQQDQIVECKGNELKLDGIKVEAKPYSSLQLFRYDLINEIETQVEGYNIQEKDYLSPLFAKPFGDTYILYTEIKGVIQDQDLFKDKNIALKLAETFMADQLKLGILKVGYLIIDVNQKKVVVSKGENKSSIK